MNANDLLMGAGTPAAKFPTPGTSVTGRIVREPEAREQTDLNTGEVKRFANGDPMMQIVVHLATDERDPQDTADDGTRAVYIKGNMLNAVRTAVRAARAAGLEVGGTLTVTYTGDGEPTKRGFNAPKLYAAVYRPPTGEAANSVLMGGNGAQAAAPAVTPTAVAAVTPELPRPANIAAELWQQMDDTQRRAVLAATGQSPAF